MNNNQYPSAEIAAKHGMTVVYSHDVEQHVPFNLKNLEAVPFFEKGGKRRSVNTDMLCVYAVRNNLNLGLVDAQYILDNQKDIPSKLRGKNLVFAGTRLQAGDKAFLPYLCWGMDSQWHLEFRPVDLAWGEGHYLVRCKS